MDDCIRVAYADGEAEVWPIAASAAQRRRVERRFCIKG